MHWGSKIEFLKDLEDKGINPPALENRPDVFTWMDEYLKAFQILSSRRTVGMELNPISLQDIRAYIDLFGCDDIEMFTILLSRMDSAFLKFNRSKK